MNLLDANNEAIGGNVDQNKSAWTLQEDTVLIQLVEKIGA